jgi:hypothetical protein
MAATTPTGVAVLSEGITYAVSRLVDDWKEPREPSHGDLKFVFRFEQGIDRRWISR